MVMLYVVTGPPASGKSTYVRQHAKRGDVTIDYDSIANVLTVPHPDKPHDHPRHIQTVTKAARQAAIDAAIKHSRDVDVYIIHSSPGEQMMQRYLDLGAEIITIDPGRDVVLARCKAERPWRIHQAAKHWYASKPPTTTSKHMAGTDTTDTSRQW